MQSQIKSAIADATERQRIKVMTRWQKGAKEDKTRRGHGNNNFDSQDGKKKLAICMILTKRRDQNCE